KQALLRATGPLLVPEFLPSPLGPLLSGPAADPETPAQSKVPSLEQFLEERLAAGSTDLYAEALAWLEQLLLPRVLRHVGGSQVQAARLLGITRGSLRGKLRALGLRIDRTVTGEAGEELPNHPL